MMRNAVLGLPQQFAYIPTVINKEKMPRFKRVIVAGMGGSHLAADLLAMLDPTFSVTVHSDYGLPFIAEEDKADTLLIASSYSGNTEETLDAYDMGRAFGLSVAVVAVGGKLIERAERDGMPYVRLPDTGIQPRSALGFSLRALATLLQRQDLISVVSQLAGELKPESLEADGKVLAAWLQDRVPVIYATRMHAPIAYNWKIKLNETGKIPAFYNLVPELNHNEMTGFDVQPASKSLSERFAFIFLVDRTNDHPKNIKRMEVMARLYADRGLPVREIFLEGSTEAYKAFASLVLADWTAIELAKYYGLESEQVPMVEEFKKSLA